MYNYSYDNQPKSTINNRHEFVYNLSAGEEYLDDKPRRIYKVEPFKKWMNSDSEVNGNYIDVRKEVEN